MRRALALVLGALLASGPALAGRAIVIQPGSTPGAPPIGAPEAGSMQRRLSFYRTLGIDFDVFPYQAMKTEWARTLAVPVNGETRTYVAGIQNEFSTTANGAPAGSPYVPDSLLMQARWPTGPWVLFAMPVLPGTGVLADRSSPFACSTGFASNAAPSNSNNYQSNFYVPGSNWYWRSVQSATRFTPNALTPPAAGVWRILVRENRGAWGPYAQQGLAPQNWDSTATGAQDTISSVARYKKNGAGPPMIITATGFNHFFPPYGQMLQSLALADSAAGRQLLGQTRPLPIRFNIQVGPLAASGSYAASSAAGLDEGIGPYPGDSVAVKATLAGYQAMGLKGTVLLQTNADSVAAFANHYEWVRTLWPLAKVSPFDKAGVTVPFGPGIFGAATPTKAHDVYGSTRERSLFPAGETDPRDGCDCSTDTTSVYCGVTRQFAFLTRYFGASRVDRVIAAPLEDWSPLYFNRSRGSMDSLKWCLWLAKVKGVRVGNYSFTNDVGSPGAGSPRGYWSTLRVEDVRDPATSEVVGQIVFMPSRDFDTAANANPPTHDVVMEFLDGLFCGDWYTASRSPVYVNSHNFFSRTVILEFSGAALGGTGAALGNWRYGYWFARGLWAQCQAANRFGRKIIEPSYGEETAEWVMRSGLR